MSGYFVVAGLIYFLPLYPTRLILHLQKHTKSIEFQTNFKEKKNHPSASIISLTITQTLEYSKGGHGLWNVPDQIVIFSLSHDHYRNYFG